MRAVPQTEPSVNPVLGSLLPPLKSVIVFAEAARHCNFSRAALNLGMTQSGVSRHVGNLECWLGQPLFLRSGGQLALTDVGRLYLESVKEAVETIYLASRQLQRRGTQTQLQVLTVRTSLPTFAMNVLIPVLPRFKAEHQISVEVLTALSLPSPGDKCDVLVTRDLIVPDAEQWHLASEDLICVASPSLRIHCERTAIHTWPYLAPRSRPDILLRWASVMDLGADRIQIAAGFDHLFLAIASAISGAGVLVVPKVLVSHALQQELLCELRTGPARGNFSYVALVHPTAQNPDTARVFCRWLKGLLTSERT